MGIGRAPDGYVFVGSEEIILRIRQRVPRRSPLHKVNSALGVEIGNLMTSLEAVKVRQTKPYWTRPRGNPIVGADDLPWTAELYRIRLESLPALYLAVEALCFPAANPDR